MMFVFRKHFNYKLCKGNCILMCERCVYGVKQMTIMWTFWTLRPATLHLFWWFLDAGCIQGLTNLLSLPFLDAQPCERGFSVISEQHLNILLPVTLRSDWVTVTSQKWGKICFSFFSVHPNTSHANTVRLISVHIWMANDQRSCWWCRLYRLTKIKLIRDM